MSFLGRHVFCEHLPGKAGVVAHMNDGGTGYWTKAVTYNVVWDDLSCTRSVSHASMEGPAWNVVPGDRLSENECDALWFRCLMERNKHFAEKARSQRNDAAVSSSKSNSESRSFAPPVSKRAAEAFQQLCGDPNGIPPRQVTHRIKDLLAKEFPRGKFAVTCERQVATVSWLDGVLSKQVYAVVAKFLDDGSIRAIRTKRGMTESNIQSAIDYCVDVVFKGRTDSPEFVDAKLRLTPEDYQRGLLDSVFPPSRHAASGVSYQRLIRCVCERWDAYHQRFTESKATSAMREELMILFPYGDDQATADHRALLASSAESSASAVRVFETMRG